MTDRCRLQVRLRRSPRAGLLARASDMYMDVTARLNLLSAVEATQAGMQLPGLARGARWLSLIHQLIA